jgi:hypothetical protein
MARPSILKTFHFHKVLPYHDEIKLPETAGVFVIIRYGTNDSSMPEFLDCAEAINMRRKAIEIVNANAYTDFPRALEYYIKEEESEEKRIQLLQQVKQICKSGN